MKTRKEVAELWEVLLNARMDEQKAKEKFIDFFCDEESELPKKEWHFEPDDPYLHLKLAQAAGKVIQQFDKTAESDAGRWIDLPAGSALYFAEAKYLRIKPEEKKLVSFEEALVHYKKGGDYKHKTWYRTFKQWVADDTRYNKAINICEILSDQWELLP